MTSRPRVRRSARALLLVLGVSLAAGCARDRPAAAPGVPAVRGAWVRPAAAGADGALYFTLANPGGDTLVVVGARSDAAASTSLHESMRTGDGAGAMVHMAPLARLAVPPADSVVFAPLGRHAMLEGLLRPLAAGDSVPFAVAVTRGRRADTLRATAIVRAF